MVKLVTFGDELIQNLKTLSKDKNRPIIVIFDGFRYQSLVTDSSNATSPIFLVLFIRIKYIIQSSAQFILAG